MNPGTKTEGVLRPGQVCFAGAGPGAPDLLTVRCCRAIAEADVIVYAGSLVAPEVLSGAPAGCRLVDSAGLDLPSIVEVLITAARQGLRVLRLHTGDPALYGAVAEQMALLDQAGIPYEMIPGVSAVFAAAASLRTELTLPEVSQTLILSRRAGRTPMPEGEALAGLAAHRATLALYLSVGDLAGVVADLRAGGYPSGTPAAVVYRASWPDEQVVTGTLATIAEQVRQAGIGRQAVILVGPALDRAGAPGSRLYAPDFSHGFRNAESSAAVEPKPVSDAPFFSGRVAVYALTAAGCGLALRLGAARGWDVFPSRSRLEETPAAPVRVFPFEPGDLGALIAENWGRYDGHLLIMAAGIAMRKIAPLLADKGRDPAVVVCDEQGRYAVSLVAGHLGGANRLARVVAKVCGGQAVVSTATDVQGLPAFDDFAARHGLEILNQEGIKVLNSLLLAGRPIAWIDPHGRIPAEFRECGQVVAATGLDALPPGIAAAVLTGEAPGTGKPGLPLLRLRPLPLVVGVGCRRGTPAAEILAAVDQVLADHGLEPERVTTLSSIDLKADEPGLHEAAAAHSWQTAFFPAGELTQEPVPTPSDFVRSVTGSPSVAEAAALAAGKGRLLVPKQIRGPVTLAVACLQPSPGVRAGRLAVVGIGAGTLEGMTRQAVEALRTAEVVVGYRDYCERIAPLTAGKRVVASGMGEEIGRCDTALDLAMAGRVVALVCSGDAGIYGMAGLVFERIEARRLAFDAVRVVPGVTAASLAAAAAGAPLMNDFAVLSLSDLLTDRAVVLRRVEGIARSGLACVLYNPASHRRRDLLDLAVACFLRERGDRTLAALVTDAGRSGEAVRIARLADLPLDEVSMSSVLIIAGAGARCIGKWLVEPRGYATKAGFRPGDGP